MQNVIFVGGAPRTGTTLLNALLCTSKICNNYIAECSYFTNFMKPFYHALFDWDTHTKYYFSSLEDLSSFHAGMLNRVLERIAGRLGTPDILVLKDPYLTQGFEHVARLVPSAKFAVMIRDPRDAILSRIEVHRRLAGAEPTRDDVGQFCNDYCNAYRAVLHFQDELQARMVFVDYRDLVSGRVNPQAEQLGITDIDPDKIWLDAVTDISQYAADPWSTHLYGQKISDRSLNRYKTAQGEEWNALIVERCGSTARMLNAEWFT